MSFKMTEAKGSSEVRRFLKLPRKIYKGDPNWIEPLDKDIEDVFNPEKNKRIKQGGKIKRWLLENENGEAIGRISAFIDPKYKQDQPTGGIGFFDCIKDEKAAFFMFDYCRDWLKEQGMEAMDGPINFGERNNFWGLLVEGFHEPLYAMNYNPPYYKDFFENYGFKVYFYQECYGMDIALSFSDKMNTRHKEILEHTNLKARHLVKKEWKKYAKDFAYVYNQAWAAHGEGKALDERMAIKMFQSMHPVMEEEINWFVYDGDEPVSFWINLPDLNQWFKHFQGSFGWWQKVRFLWMKKFLPNNKMTGIVFGIIPKWQGKGVDSFMIIEGTTHLVKYLKYEKYEMQWLGDFNPKMINVAKGLEAHLTRKLATYRYLFDRNKPFKRHPIINT